VRYVLAVEAVRSLTRNDSRCENNIKMSIKYWQNLAQTKCNAVLCKRGNKRNILDLPFND
jgi:hypothetical protein